MRRHRPIGSLKYPGPHFRLAVPPAAVAEAEVAATADGDCATNGTADGAEDGAADDDDDDDGATVVTGDGGSVGMSDVFPLLAISASTIWTILSLVDDEYGSSRAGDGEYDVLLAMATAAVLDGGVLVVDGVLLGDGGLDVPSIGSV